MKILEMYHYINTLSQLTDRSNNFMLDRITDELKENYIPTRPAAFLCVQFSIMETVDNLYIDTRIMDFRYGVTLADYIYTVDTQRQLDIHTIDMLDELKEKSGVFNQVLSMAKDALQFVMETEHCDDIPVVIELYSEPFIEKKEFDTIADAIEW